MPGVSPMRHLDRFRGTGGSEVKLLLVESTGESIDLARLSVRTSGTFEDGIPLYGRRSSTVGRAATCADVDGLALRMYVSTVRAFCVVICSAK